MSSSNTDTIASAVPRPKLIFWPKGLFTAGFLYGWRNPDNVVCIVGSLSSDVVEADVAIDGVKAAQALVNASVTLSAASSAFASAVEACGPLSIVALLLSSSSGEENLDDKLLTIRLTNRTPLLVRHTADADTRIVLYERPNARQLRFLATQAIDIDVASYAVSQHSDITSFPKSRTAKNVAVHATFEADPGVPTPLPIDLQKIILQINHASNIYTALHSTGVHADKAAKLSMTMRFPAFLAQGVKGGLSSCISLLSYRCLGDNALRDIAAIAHQADIRLRQVAASLMQYTAIYQRTTIDPGKSSTHYISFYGTIWLIANDIIIGSAITTFLRENETYLTDVITAILREYTIRRLQNLLLWLNDWPGGLKLNYELGKLFCDAFLWFTNAWEISILDRILFPSLPFIIRLISTSAMLGTTMAVSMACDLLSLATLHLYAFYVMSTAIFGFHIKTMASLFRTFRGKKRNEARNRNEPTEYSLDQLLVGAMLFTLAAFLLPTVLAYYLVFALGRIGVISLHASLEAILAFLNHFPLFVFMLRVKDPSRLPGGLCFEIQHKIGHNAALEMKNKPISLSAIFHQYFALWRAFSQHYSPIALCKKLLSGGYIHAIQRSRLVFSDLTSRNDQ